MRRRTRLASIVLWFGVAVVLVLVGAPIALGPMFGRFFGVVLMSLGLAMAFYPFTGPLIEVCGKLGRRLRRRAR